MERLILVTGATGYVGGQLLRRLLETGYRVRCLVRRVEALAELRSKHLEVVQGDALDPASLRRAMEGADTAYYLIHSMAESGSFEAKDRAAAQLFAQAAQEAGLQRIIYLGGLGRQENLSAHLRSRHEVGDLLRSSGVPVIEFRASIVIGAGSLSFEMIRALVERLPVMIAPRWVGVPAQPIAIADLLAYLLAALDLPLDGSRTFEIGGADRVSYGDLMREYARQRGLRRLIIPVPVLTPHLSSLWLGLVTPLYVRVGRKLIESIRHPTVVEDDAALSVFPIRPRGYREAIAEALVQPHSGLLKDSRCIHVSASPEVVFEQLRQIGSAGWYYADWLWRLRGAVDVLFGGSGLRRNRNRPEELRVGEAVDWWRVEVLEPGKRLRLRAEMKLPGRAWLDFELEGDSTGSIIRQTALFDPRGLLGRAYWYAVLPLHHLVFDGLLRRLAARAEGRAQLHNRPVLRIK